MAAPTSAQPLPDALRNSTAPIADERGFITHTWRYIFGLFAQKSTTVSPTWTQSISNPPTQAEVQAIVAQVTKISAVVGRT